ncbi:unnamed protein product [Rhizoctonia solani]|uniref:Nucleolar complex-associated protein 3 N-terminal domain-containing protein n=1 Tax=Rhizoctonia solani TaxID=456999 RepID=A0A8H3DAM8_9AGAM|nr:unnamed protein product [Rhizoctonia solani]
MKLKRSAAVANGKPRKKQKVDPVKKSKAKGKERAFERATIPIPEAGSDEEDQDIEEEGLDYFRDGGNIQFLASLDKKGIARSKKETERLHKLNKPIRESRRVDDDLPSVESHSDDGEDWSSLASDILSDEDALSDEDVDSDDDLPSVESHSDDGEDWSSLASDILSDEDALSDEDVDSDEDIPKRLDSDEELPYEIAGRPRPPSPKRQTERLPIKLGDGRIQSTGAREVQSDSEENEESEEDDNMTVSDTKPPVIEDVATGARFGRPAVRDIVNQKSRKARIEAAKEQLASICQEIMAEPENSEIMAEPENSLGLLRRLHTFALPDIPGGISKNGEQLPPTPNDPRIRTLALLSQLAIFKDIVPGYRIRALTEHEKAEKVSQAVQRTRDWEQGLVGVYQNYLKLLEAEVKAKSELDQVALKCMCALLTSITHFNFNSNIMATIVARLSKRSWDEVGLA